MKTLPYFTVLGQIISIYRHTKSVYRNTEYEIVFRRFSGSIIIFSEKLNICDNVIVSIIFRFILSHPQFIKRANKIYEIIKKKVKIH